MSRFLIVGIGSLAAFTLLALVQHTFADAIVDAPERPWEACGDCHGIDGISATAHFPKLAGQKRAYIEKELRDFHSGLRANDNGQMSGIGGFSNHALELAAAYFSQLPAPSPASFADNDISRAKTIVETGLPKAGIVACLSCHNADTNIEPWLEAQHAGYLTKQLKDFKSGARGNDNAMADIARRLSDADIEKVANYLAATPRPSSKH
jgi:cytochrome c553